MVNILKKHGKVILRTIALLFLFFVGLYLWAINGEPYKQSLEFVKNNKQVIEVLGEIKDLRLSFFGKYFITSDGTNGHAEYKIIVKGEKEKGQIFVKLVQNVGKWKIVSANLKLNSDEIIKLQTKQIKG